MSFSRIVLNPPPASRSLTAEENCYDPEFVTGLFFSFQRLPETGKKEWTAMINASGHLIMCLDRLCVCVSIWTDFGRCGLKRSPAFCDCQAVNHVGFSVQPTQFIDATVHSIVCSAHRDVNRGDQLYRAQFRSFYSNFLVPLGGHANDAFIWGRNNQYN